MRASAAAPLQVVEDLLTDAHDALGKTAQGIDAVRELRREVLELTTSDPHDPFWDLYFRP